MKRSKDKIIAIFYILYFSWLLTITYLTRDLLLINYFSILVTGFYFLLLREKYDGILFFAAAFVSIILTFFVLENMSLPNDYFDLSQVPLWLPAAWGITVISLKKFGLMIMYR